MEYANEPVSNFEDNSIETTLGQMRQQTGQNRSNGTLRSVVDRFVASDTPADFKSEFSPAKIAAEGPDEHRVVNYSADEVQTTTDRIMNAVGGFSKQSVDNGPYFKGPKNSVGSNPWFRGLNAARDKMAVAAGVFSDHGKMGNGQPSELATEVDAPIDAAGEYCSTGAISTPFRESEEGHIRPNVLTDVDPIVDACKLSFDDIQELQEALDLLSTGVSQATGSVRPLLGMAVGPTHKRDALISVDEVKTQLAFVATVVDRIVRKFDKIQTLETTITSLKATVQMLGHNMVNLSRGEREADAAAQSEAYTCIQGSLGELKAAVALLGDNVVRDPVTLDTPVFQLFRVVSELQDSMRSRSSDTAAIRRSVDKVTAAANSAWFNISRAIGKDEPASDEAYLLRTSLSDLESAASHVHDMVESCDCRSAGNQLACASVAKLRKSMHRLDDSLENAWFNAKRLLPSSAKKAGVFLQDTKFYFDRMHNSICDLDVAFKGAGDRLLKLFKTRIPAGDRLAASVNDLSVALARVKHSATQSLGGETKVKSLISACDPQHYHKVGQAIEIIVTSLGSLEANLTNFCTSSPGKRDSKWFRGSDPISCLQLDFEKLADAIGVAWDSMIKATTQHRQAAPLHQETDPHAVYALSADIDQLRQSLDQFSDNLFHATEGEGRRLKISIENLSGVIRKTGHGLISMLGGHSRPRTSSNFERKESNGLNRTWSYETVRNEPDDPASENTGLEHEESSTSPQGLTRTITQSWMIQNEHGGPSTKSSQSWFRGAVKKSWFQGSVMSTNTATGSDAAQAREIPSQGVDRSKDGQSSDSRVMKLAPPFEGNLETKLAQLEARKAELVAAKDFRSAAAVKQQIKALKEREEQNQSLRASDAVNDAELAAPVSAERLGQLIMQLGQVCDAGQAKMRQVLGDPMYFALAAYRSKQSRDAGLDCSEFWGEFWTHIIVDIGMNKCAQLIESMLNDTQAKWEASTAGKAREQFLCDMADYYTCFPGSLAGNVHLEELQKVWGEWSGPLLKKLDLDMDGNVGPEEWLHFWDDSLVDMGESMCFIQRELLGARLQQEFNNADLWGATSSLTKNTSILAKQLFSLCDRDGNGCLNKHELLKALPRENRRFLNLVSESTMLRMFRELQLVGDHNKIVLSEWLDFWLRMELEHGIGITQLELHRAQRHLKTVTDD